MEAALTAATVLKCASSAALVFFTYAGNGGQSGSVGLFLHCALAVVVGVAVGLVLNVRDKRKDIAVAVDGDLAALVVHNGAGAVVVILDHAEGRHMLQRCAAQGLPDRATCPLPPSMSSRSGSVANWFCGPSGFSPRRAISYSAARRESVSASEA